jgi:cytochrome c peroxidase
MRFGSMGRLAFGAAVLALAACGGGARDTPAGVSDVTTIDFANVANYSAPRLPAYFDRTVTALDNSPASNPGDDRVATLGRVLFYDSAAEHQRPGLVRLVPPAGVRLYRPDAVQQRDQQRRHHRRPRNAARQPALLATRLHFLDRRAASAEAQASHPLHSLVEMGWGGAAGGSMT